MSQSASEGRITETGNPSESQLNSASEGDLVEGGTPPGASPGTADARDLDPEAPLADALEQRADVDLDSVSGVAGDLPLEANPADVAEQLQSAGHGEDDYRAP